MKRSLWMVLIGILVMSLAVQPVTAQPAWVSEKVWADTEGGATAHFLVVLRAQADRPAADGAAFNRDASSAYVNTLMDTAAASQPALTARLDAMGVSYRAYWIVNMLAVEGDRQVVEALAALPEVAYIEPDRAFRVALETGEEERPADAKGTIQPNISRVGAPDLWALGVMGTGTVVANADTGIYWEHSLLKSQYRGWDGAAANHNFNWWDAIHQDIDGSSNPCGYESKVPCDDHGHGTHTTGTSVGLNGYGVAPAARWIGCRNMDSGVGRPSTYIECLQFFMAPTDLNGQNPNPALRPDVISNSYGCPAAEQCNLQSLTAAVESVRAAGIFMSVSAGNDGPTCDTVNDPPGTDRAVFTVGAVNNSDGIASFSSRGPAGDLMKPQIVAPGVSVVSASKSGETLTTTMSGTSMAAPNVAGGVALLWSAFPSLRGNVPWTELILTRSAVPLTTTEGCGGDSASQVPNNTYGYGRLDLVSAYNKSENEFAHMIFEMIFLPMVIH
ncbi:MAG TPA: S8 family serine peptidase [Anaerolineaceae bacterium]|nr:S8 family serine peptidase [Anaerolineaceae bacterium]HPN53671.1 S8 family serine peptidase [Anaerolineaceae bacterium]